MGGFFTPTEASAIAVFYALIVSFFVLRSMKLADLPAILTRSVDIMISRLRGKLGDSVKPPRFIQTIWGRGYSFVGVPVSDA